MGQNSVSLVPGSAYSFLYPRHNFHGVLSKFEPRRLKVTDLRNLVEEPLESVTIEMQPLLRRGPTLVTGLDLDKHAERSFYLHSMKRIVELRDCG